MNLPSDSKQTSTNSGRGQVRHLVFGLPPLALPLRVLPAGRPAEKERILYSIPRKRHDRQGRLLNIAELNRKGFWNLVRIQKSSLCRAVDSRLKDLLWFSCCIYSCIFIPQTPVSERVWCVLPFLQRENGKLKRSQATLNAGKAVGSSAEEIQRYSLRATADNNAKSQRAAGREASSWQRSA